MAPATKRKATDDDFVFTLQDIEGEIPEEEASAPPPKKKTKTKTKTKKGKQAPVVEDDGSENEADGIWGSKINNDGAMDSDFEFITDAGALDDGFDGWGFDGAKNGVDTERQGVDIEDIIRRRREKRVKKDEGGGEGGDEEAVEDGEDVEDGDSDGMELDLDDGDDQVLADDAFGMNLGSDVEESDDEGQGNDSDDEDGDGDDDAAADSDSDESTASAVPHPDDELESDYEDETDAEEEAKRKAFFAPEDDTSKTDKKTAASFQTMGLSRPIARGLGAVGFSRPTPIQVKTIPIALLGKDIVGGAVTGSGKTAAFLVPIMERLMFRPKKVAVSRVVILAPTRELAIQCFSVATKLAAYTDIKFTLAVGGLSLKVQEAELRQRPDVIIATPGRFIDHMRNSASFSVDTIEILVLDEADRMLEDGFADELNEILTTLPKSRQTMLFSATMTSSVDDLIRVGLNKPARIMVDSQQKTVGTLAQEFVRLRPGREGKRMGYLIYLCKTLYQERVIIFFRQKTEAHRARVIFALLGLSCAELHGSMNQTQRIASVEGFRDGKVSYLLATDLASRGLDIKGVDTVINYEAPQKLEIYIHRIGRTARAGRSGVACTLAAEPDRKVVKAAVKAGKAQGAKISSRLVEASDADKWQAKIDGLEEEIEAVMRDEKEERQMAHVEMQLKKGENILEHEAEIKARPKRTWFETQDEKKKAKEVGKAELNGVTALREKLKHKGQGNLSNKDKKKLDLKAERAGGGSGWRKGAAERVGKGVVADMRRGKVMKAKGKSGGKPPGGKPRKAGKLGGKPGGKPGRK